MTKPHIQWTVLPHGTLTRVDERLFCVTGIVKMPLGDFDRRMTIARLDDGRLVIYSAIALDEAQMQTVEQIGEVAFLVVPNDHHRLDIKGWKERYPAARVLAPAGARASVEAVVPVDGTTDEFGDSCVRLVTVPGTGEREAALVVEASDGITLVLNDLIFNSPTRPGLGGWIYQLIGATGTQPHMPKFVKMREVADRVALAAQFELWSRMPNLTRIIVSHGTIIVGAPAMVLDRIAHELAA